MTDQSETCSVCGSAEHPATIHLPPDLGQGERGSRVAAVPPPQARHGRLDGEATVAREAPTDGEVEREWLALVDYALHSPDHWTTRRYHLETLGDPPMTFKREVLRIMGLPFPVAAIAPRLAVCVNAERLRQSRERVAGAQAATVDLAPKRPGPPLAATAEAALRVRAELQAAGKPAGYKSVARVLDVSTSTARRRLTGD
jgi:hypothetical protein